MAAAEARTAWQRAANRCFVQEDAKRAPKFACCSSKLQSDPGYEESGNGLDHSAEIFMPPNWNPTNSNLAPDTKWWLQLQPNFGNQRDFTYERLNAIESELDDTGDGDLNPISKVCEDPLTSEDRDSYLGLESEGSVSAANMKRDSGPSVPELRAVNIQQSVKHEIHAGENLKVDFGEYWFKDSDLMDWKPVDQLMSDLLEKVPTDFASPWVGVEKTGSWWRTADKDELASLVAQKSLEHVENCDLPPPQKRLVGRGPLTDFECFDLSGKFSSHNFSDGGRMSEKESDSNDACHSLHDYEKLSSTHKGTGQSTHHNKNDPGKAQLLEALCHSQTRAREAEKAAHQANSEKEHIIKLFFRQASLLFAYKQWLKLLQLETLILQIKSKDHQLSELFPALPWMPLEGRRFGKHRKTRRKVGVPKYEISKFAFVFAVGLGLAGAGLFLGWTMGWLLPAF